MPGRAVFNNCVFFIANVKKIVNKQHLNNDEFETRKMATIIAALSSNHSWKTYKYLNNYCELDKEAIVAEANKATKDGWQYITENDVEEVVNANFNEHVFSLWLFYAVDKKEREEYLRVFGKFKKNFEYGLEPMERVVQ
ncbi:MAG: hypothetical protein M1122_03115 [Candidatus Marsarchaeota archaeon]|jgi:hypothetical protein|nr:hypothetical protein [Candidatus Marsarchaeota archaeon]